MPTSSDLERETKMKTLIEHAFEEASASAGTPEILIEGWAPGEWDPELRVVVGGKQSVLEVSHRFLEGEPDEDDLRYVSTAVRELLRGETRRVRLNHHGAYAVYGHANS